MTGWNEIKAALDRAEKEIARLHAENAELRLGQAVPGYAEQRRHDPGNHLRRIDHIWAFLSLDEAGEGVCAGPLGPYPFVPLIAADPAQLAQLGPLAREIARRADRVIILAKFGSREDVERIEP